MGKLSPGAPGNPAEFGPYLLFGLIARGGMAEVYRARRADGRHGMLAIKVMRPQLAREARFVEMFVREGRLAMLFNHPTVVRTLDVGEAAGRYFICMEYIPGKDLTQVLRRCQETGQRLPVPHAMAIAASICEGLDYAHTLADAEGRPLNVVNRDVSPSNVRVAFDGRIKLIDFGIAQAMLKVSSEIGVLKGKFSYMSPEQIRGLPVDARTDVFSTGIILHEMLTTEKLFRGDNEFALMEKVRQAEVLPPSRFNRRVSPELDAVCLRALARDLEQRYPSAAALRADLLGLLGAYRYQPGELEEFMGALFRADVAREQQDLRDCTLHPLPGEPHGYDEDSDVIVIEASGIEEISPPPSQPTVAPTVSPASSPTREMALLPEPAASGPTARAPGIWSRIKKTLQR